MFFSAIFEDIDRFETSLCYAVGFFRHRACLSGHPRRLFGLCRLTKRIVLGLCLAFLRLNTNMLRTRPRSVKVVLTLIAVFFV